MKKHIHYFIALFFVLFFSSTSLKAQWVADFNASLIANGCSVGTYSFASTVTNNGVVQSPTTLFYHWDFGNGTDTGAQQLIGNTLVGGAPLHSPNRSYLSPGNYTVLLRVYSAGTPAFGAGVLLASVTKVVTIFTTPVPNFTADVTDICLGDPVTFTDIANYGGQPSVGPVISRNWNFGDGNQSFVSNPADVDVVHTYTTPGDYQVTLTTRTSGGRPGEECAGALQRPMYIRVRHRPTASFTINPVPPACTFPYAPTVTNTSTIAATPAPAGAIASYVWRFYSGPTDASPELPFSPINTLTTAPPSIPPNAYNAPGSYAITLEAISTTGCRNVATRLLNINVPQTADFNLPAATQICAGGTVQFTDASTAGATSYAWTLSGATPSTSTAQNPTVTFATSGTYNITLNVTYPDGCVRTVSKPYTVTVAPAPVANFTNTPTDGFCITPKNVTFTPLQAQNPNYTYTWNFGENIGPGLTGPIALGYSLSNIYEQFGSYNVTLTVRDNITGCETTVVRVLTLVDPVVSIIPRNPVQGCAPLTVNFDISMNAIEPITQYRIDYDGDGTYETTVIPTHTPPTPFTALTNFTYTNRGNFIPAIEITTLNGCTKRVTSATPIRVGTPPQITSISQTGGVGGCQAGGISFEPVFPMGFAADSIIYTFSDGSPAVSSNTPPFRTTHTFTQNGAQGITVTAFFNGCPINIPFNHTVAGGAIQSPIANLQVVGGQPDLCTGSPTNNQVCVNISGTQASPTAPTIYTVNFGDGNIQTFSSATPAATLANICNTYLNPGTYNITLTATGNNGMGCVDTRTQQITISPNASVNVDFNINPNPSNSCSANPVGFSSTSTVTAPGITITGYRWNFGDGSPVVTLAAPAGANTTHIYSPSATPYNPTLTLVLSNGCEKVYSGAVKVVNIQGPILNINATPSLLGCVGDPINFQGLATLIPAGNTIVSWDWDFGDPASGVNNVATTQNTPHTFATAGTYTVTLRARDNNSLQSGSPSSPGCIATRTVQVQIFAKPTASFTINRPTVCVGSSVTFTSTTNAGMGATYLWDFGDGNTSNAPNPVYTYTTPAGAGTSANRTVSLTVTNAAGCSITTTQNFTVLNVDFTITANGSTSPITLNCPPKSVNFVSSFIPMGTDPTGWTFNWQFGDGNQANTQNATNEYNSPNAPSVFDVTFTATNTATGCQIVKNLTAFITVTGPRGTFTFAPENLCKPGDVTFTATNLTGNPVQIIWDFGDGSSNVVQTITPGIDPTVTHTYTTSGSFLPNITLVDGSVPTCRVAYPSPGLRRVNVSGVPNANFTWTGGGLICRNIVVNFTDQSTPDPLTGPAMNPQVNRWSWTIYDGTNGPAQPGTDDPILFNSSAQNPSYTFTTAKSYLVRLNVQTAFNQGGVPDGCPAFIDKVITIVDPTITANITSIVPLNRCPGEPITFTGQANTNVNPKTLTGTWRVYQNPMGVTTPSTAGPLVATINATATAGALATDPWGMTGNYAFPASGTYTIELIAQDVALCTGGAVATQVVTVDPLPSFVSNPNNQAICVGQTATFTVLPSAASLAAPGVTYQWQQSDDGGMTWINVVNGATLGGAVYGGATTDNFTVTNGSIQLNGYRYRAVITKQNTTQCQATSGVGGLTVNQTPSIAQVNTPNINLCNITTTNLDAVAPAVGTGTWTKLPSSPAGGAITNINANNTTVTGLLFGTYTYRWTVGNGSCPSSFADVVIVNSQPANAGLDQNICNAATITLTGNDPATTGSVGATGTWTVVNNPSGATITFSPNANSSTVTVNGATADALPYVFRWTITGSTGCGNTNDDVSILNSPLPSVSNPLAQTICAGQNATFAVTGSPALSYQWQVDDNGGSGFVNLSNIAPYSGATTPTLTITNPSAAFNNFRYRIIATNTTTNCASTTNSATLTIFPANTEVLSISTPNPTCIGSPVTLTLSNTQMGYTYQLRNGVTPVMGVAVLNGNGASQSFASFNPTATATYNVLVTSPTVNGVSCNQQLASTVTAVINPNPSTAVAGADRDVCGTTTNLNATAPTIGTGAWSVITGPAVIAPGDITNPNAPVTGLQIGINRFRWTVTSGVCPPSTAEVVITGRPVGVPANAGTDQTICSTVTTSATLAGNDPGATGSGTWTRIAGGGTIINPTQFNSGVTGLTVGINTFRWTVLDLCTNVTTFDDITINLEIPPTLPSVTAPINLCGGTNSTPISANTPTSGTGVWTVVTGTGLFANANNPNTTVSGLSTGLNTFRWTISNSCGSNSADLNVTVSPTVSPSNAGADQNLCSTVTTSATLNANTPVVGVGAWTVRAGGATITTPSAPNSGVTGLTAGVNTFRWTITDACGNSTFDEITINLRSTPTVASAGASQNICGVTTSTLAANAVSAANGEVGTWFVTAGTGIFANANNPNTTVSGLSTGLNTFEWRITNTCGTSVSPTSVTVTQPPSTANAGADQNICANVTVLNATAPANGTGTWSYVSGPIAPNILQPNNPTSPVTGLGIGTTILRWTVSTGGGCTTSTDEVSITSNNNSVFAYAGPNVIQCANTVTLQANTPAVGTNFYWTLPAGVTVVTGTLGTPGGANGTPTLTVTGLQIGSNVFRWTVGYVGFGCSSAISDVDITRTDPAPTVNAGANQTICQTLGSTTLNGNTPSVGTGTWTVVTQPMGANVTFVNANQSNTVANGFTIVGNYTLQWTITNGTCASNNATVQIAVTASPTAANAGTNQTICANTATLGANVPTVGTGTWSLVSQPSGGAAAIATPTANNSGITGLTVAGDYVFRWTISNGTCTPSTSDVTITRLANPTPSNAGTNQTICANTVNLNGNIPAVGVGTWTVAAPMGAMVTFNDVNSPTATANGLTVAGNYTFTWTIANAPCTPSASSVTVTVNGTPTTATVGATQDVCGTTATLTGNSPIVGIGAWTVIAGGATVNAPNQFNSTVSGLTPGVNRFRWTISNGNCASTSADLVINSFTPPSTANAGANVITCDPTGSAVLSAVVPTAGIGTWTLQSGSGSIISPNSPSTQVTGLGFGANVFRWTVTNGVCPSAGNFSDVTVTRRGAVSLSVAGTSQTICGATFNLNANTPNAAAGETGSWTVIGGATLSSLTDPQATASNLAVGANVFTWTVTNGCATSVSSIIITRNDNVTPSNAGTPQTICATSTSLNGNTPTIGSGLWTVQGSPTGFMGTITFGNNASANTVVSGMTLAGTYTFRWTISNGVACTPSSSDVTITVQTPPSTANAGLNQTVCATTATLGATAPAVGTGAWTVIQGGGSVVTSTSPTSQVTNLGVGINVFRWTVSNGTCTPSISDVTITREATPTVANAGTDQSTCNTTFTLAGNTPTVGTGTWTLTAGSGTITNPNSPTSTVTGLGLGINTFTWTITNGTCPASVSSVNITRNPAPAVATVGVNQTTCSTIANLTGNVPAAGNTGTWTVTAGGASVTDVNNPASGVTGLTVGINTFRWTVANGCGSTSATLTITRDVTPTTATVGTNQVTCNTFFNALSGNAPTSGTGIWTVTAGSATVTDVNNPNSGVTGLSLGVNTFRWTISNSCGTNFAEVSITRETPPTVATVGTNQTVCATTATLTGNTALVGTGVWTVTAGGATVTSVNNPTSGVTGLTVGVNTFTWTISNSCGTSSASVSITRNDLPTAANAGTDQTICASSTNLAGNTPTVGTGQWTVIGTPAGFGGTIAFGSPTSGNTSVSGLTQNGTYTFTWTISNGVCTASQASVNVTVAPLVANAGANQNLCNLTTATLAGNAVPVGATGTWTQISGATATITNINLPNTTVTGLANGTYIFRWTLAGTGCGTSTSDVTIVVSEPANAGADQSLCGVTTTNLAATPATGGNTGTWTVISGPAGLVFNNANSPTTSVTGLTGGTYVLQWQVTGACPTSNDLVNLVVSTPASAGTDISACSVTSVGLNAVPAATGTGAWSQISGPSTASFSSNAPNATVSNLQVGTYVFRWTITGSACTPSTSDVTVRISENANAGPDQNVCNATTATLAGNVAVTGTGTWTQVSGNPATITSANSPNTTITGLTTGSYTFQWTFAGGICGASNDQVVINVSPTVSAGANQTLCAAVSTILNATIPVAGTGTWTQISGPNIATISNNTINNPTVSNLLAGTYIFRWTITGTPCPNLSSDVTIVNGQIPNAGATQNVCLGSPLILAATPVSVGVGAWSQISGPSSVSFANASAPNSSVTNLTAGTYIFRWTVTGSACATNTSDVTINILGVSTANANATVSDTDYCDNQIPPSVPITVSTSQNGVRYELRNASGTVIASQTGTGNSLTFNVSPAPTTTTTYTVFALPSTTTTICNNVQLQDQAVVTVRVCERQSIGLAKTVLPLSVQPDGSVNVTYLLTVRNLGNTELTNVQITDDLTTVFPAPARYTIVTPPTAGGVLLANTGYTGTALNPNLLTGTGRLSAGETQTISFVVNVIPNALSGTYTNTAVARGERGNVVVTDRSTDGVNVDPDNDGDPRESTPTVFTLPPNLARPRIGIAKNLFSVTRQTNGSFNVVYQMTVRNYGNVPLSNVRVVDDLSVTFPSPTQFSVVGTPTATGNLVVNNSYTGTSGNTTLVNGGTLAAGESQSVTLTVNVVATSGTYNNTAVASGENGGNRVTDNSVDGVRPDPNGDGDPTPQSPTVLTLPDNNNNRPLIGVAKALTNVVRQTNGSYNITYSITVRNYGNSELNNVQISDDLGATFPSPAQFTVVGAPSATGVLTANPAFTGTGANTNLVTNGRLSVGESQTVTFTVNLIPNANTASYRNTAIGTGQDPNGRRTTDSSTDGVSPDPNGDGTPEENIPTVLNIPGDRPQIGVAKSLLSAVRQSNGSFNLTYLISVRNYGNVALSNVQVTDNLANTFPSPAQFSVTTAPTATGGLVGNAGFTGTGSNINLLTNGNLGIGERQSITFTVNLVPNASTGTFRNTAFASGQDPTGRPTSDNSTDGLNPDPDNDGDPREESPTPFTIPTGEINNNRPQIGLAKALTNAVRQTDGSYNVSYTVTVRNFGNADLNNVQISDDLVATFPSPAQFRVTSAPTATGNLTANPAFTGTGANVNLVSGGRLATGESQTVSFTVNLTPNAATAAYRNVAVGSGEDPAGRRITDTSTDGFNPDPNGDTNPEENIPTVLNIAGDTPRIGVAKSLLSAVRQSNGSFNLTYLVTVRNYSNLALSNVQVTDNLTNTFPTPAQFSVTSAPTATGNLVGNAGFTGTGNNINLLSSGNLGAGERQSITFTVNLVPNASTGTFRNTAIASGQDPMGRTTTDNSSDGLNPDPDNDGNPREESPTPFTIPTGDNNNNLPQIGLAKALTNVVRQANGSYNVTYTITARNFGNVALSNVQINDDLAATFPAPAQFTIVGTPTASGTLGVNSSFTGRGANINLINGGNLAVGETQTVSFTVNLVAGATTASYRNVATGTAQDPTGRPTTDTSTDGFNPDPNGDGNPDENIPTVLSIPADTPRIGIAKSLVSAVRQANGSFNLTYLITARNYSNVALSNVQVTDNLSNTFPAPAQFSVITPPSATGNLVGNAGFTGTGNNTNLLSSGTLGIGERQSIAFTVNVIPNATTASFRNTAIGRAQDPTGRTTTDNSSDGLNPDPNNDGNPDEESPTIFSLPITDNAQRPLGVAKNLQTPVRQADGSYNFTYQVTVRNFGNALITNLQVTDDLTTTFPAPAQFRVVGAPTSSGNLVTNPSFTGRAGNSNLLAGNGQLGVGESQTITFTVNVIPNTTNGATYRNTAIGTGTVNGNPVTDSSTEGTNPDPNGDGNPNEDTPTTFVLQPENNVRPIATRFSFTTDNCATTVLRERIILQNAGFVRITPIPNTVTPLRGVVSISADGQLIYRPALNTLGLDSLDYEICNAQNICERGRIVINVLACTTKPPIVRPDEFGTDNCTELIGNVLTNDEDPNGTAMRARVVTNQLTANGSVYSIAADGTFTYLPKGFVGRDSIEYEACNSASPLSKCGRAKIYVDVLNCEDIFIPEGFSPNGDGINDKFVIKGAERYQIKFQVYNRWGNLVFEGNRYLNDWEGTANIGVIIGEGLPDGTYYYIVDLQNGTKPRVGFFTLNR
jgi:gliding motility-associated-like protein